MGQDRESLRDLTGVRVSVEDLTPVAKANGVSSERLRVLVTEKLRRAGIPVLTIGDFPLGDPFLRIRLNTSDARGPIAYTIEVDFVQTVFMRRNPAVTFNRAQTWRATGELGVVEGVQLADTVMRRVASQAD